LGNSFIIYMSLRMSGLARLANITLIPLVITQFREDRIEASIRVPRMFKSHVQ
jgi:hypothetical protein